MPARTEHKMNTMVYNYCMNSLNRCYCYGFAAAGADALETAASGFTLTYTFLNEVRS